MISEKEIKAIVDKALLARKAREAAKKAKEAVRQPKEKGLKAKMSISDKFIDLVVIINSVRKIKTKKS